MNPELDLFAWSKNKIEIVIDLYHGGDSGQAIRYNEVENMWELICWDSSPYYVSYKSVNPFELIKIAKKYT